MRWSECVETNCIGVLETYYILIVLWCTWKGIWVWNAGGGRALRVVVGGSKALCRDLMVFVLVLV